MATRLKLKKLPQCRIDCRDGSRLLNSNHRRAAKKALSIDTTPPIVSHQRGVDASGRALPMTDEEICARAVEIASGLDALDDMGDEDEQWQTLDALMKAIDDEPLSARKRFRQ